MGSKGNQVQTQSTQTYSPNPAIAKAGNQALTGAESAAQLPFQQPVAPVAGFNPFQQQAFNQIQGMQGMAQPYFNMGNAYLQGSAAPISGQDVSQYYNPMAQNVTNQLQNIFGQQMRQTTGNATQAAGGVGADRIGVAQANLANQQGLAAGQTYAGLYNQALNAAQQQKQMMAGAGYGLAQMGPAAQAAYLQGTGALGQAGAQQQGLTQAQLSAQYQNQLAQIAYPFQTPQYLAGITGGLAPAFGGTTQGQSTTTYPTPSPLNQALGVGTSLAGLAMGGPFGGMLGGALGGGLGSMFGGGKGSYGGGYAPNLYGGQFGTGGAAYGKLAEQRFTNSPVGNPYADSSDDSNYADGGDIEQPPPFPGASVPNNSGMSPIPTMGQIPQGISPIPYIPLHPSPMQHPNLDLRPQSKTAPKLQGQETIGGDISSALKLAKGVNNLFSASGGAVNPYDSGQGFQDGGDTFDDRWGDMSTTVPEVTPPLPRGRPLGAPDVEGNLLDRAGAGVKTIETGSPQGDYQNVTTTTNPRTGQRQSALGAYQVMENELPEWSTKVFGQPISKEEFLYGQHARQIQDTMFRQMFGESAQKRGQGDVGRGIEMAGREWFGGPGGVKNPYATDAFGRVTTGGYGQRVLASANPQPGENITGEPAEGPIPGFTPAAYTGSSHSQANADMNAGQYFLPKGDQPYPDSLKRDWGQNMARSPWMSLVSAGAKMASTVGPVGTAIGKGIEAGVGQLEGQRKELRSEQDINMKAQHLYQQAIEQLNEYKRVKAGPAATLAQHQPLVDAQIAHLQQEAAKPFVVYKDPFTEQATYGVADKNAPNGIRILSEEELKKSGFSPSSMLSPPGTVPGTTSEAAAPELGKTAPAVPSSGIAGADTPANVHNEVLQALPMQIGNQVKALSEGRMAFPSGFALRSPYWQRMIQLVSSYDPSFDAVNYNARAKTRSDFTSGKSAQNITSFNTAIGHLNTLDKSIDNLNNTGFPLWNKLVANPLASQFDPKYQSAIKDFSAARTALTDELTRAFRGSGGNVHDIEQWEKNINTADTPAALHQVAKSAVELLRSRIEALGDTYNRGMGTTKEPLSLLSPKAQSVVNRIESIGKEPAGFTGRTASGPNGKKLRETSDGRWVP